MCAGSCQLLLRDPGGTARRHPARTHIRMGARKGARGVLLSLMIFLYKLTMNRDYPGHLVSPSKKYKLGILNVTVNAKM